MSSIDTESWAIVDSKGDISITPRPPLKSEVPGVEEGNFGTNLAILSVQDVLKNLNEMQRVGKTLYGEQRKAFNKHVSEFAEAAAHHSYAALERARAETQRVLTSFQAMTAPQPPQNNQLALATPTSFSSGDGDCGASSQDPEFDAYLLEHVIVPLSRAGIAPFDGTSHTFEQWFSTVKPYVVAALEGERNTIINHVQVVRLYSLPEIAIIIESVMEQLGGYDAWEPTAKALDDLFERRKQRLGFYETHAATCFPGNSPSGRQVLQARHEHDSSD